MHGDGYPKECGADKLHEFEGMDEGKHVSDCLVSKRAVIANSEYRITHANEWVRNTEHQVLPLGDQRIHHRFKQ